MARKKGGRRGSKRKKTSTSKYKFRDARMQYHLGNFAKAASILRQATIDPHEKAKAQQLEIAINQQIAYELFTNRQYQEVIDTLQTSIKGKENQKETWIVKTHVFVGLSYLYLGGFESAKNHLNKVLQSKETTSFAFYYLLADVYHNHASYSKDLDFFSTHPTFVASIEKEQKDYLTIIFSIFKDDIEKANTQIKLFEDKSRAQKLNVDAIHAILNQSKLNTASTNKIKPLYRLLLSLPIDFEEKKYLSDFSYLKPALEKQALLANAFNLQKTITSLCQEAIPIPSKHWMDLLEQISDEYKYALVYNQMVALSKEDFEGNMGEMLRILETLHDAFFKIPESIFLYLQIVFYDVDSHYFYIFWKNVTQYLERFSKLLTPGQLNRIGWKLYEIFMSYNRQQYANSLEDIQHMAQQYNMLGLNMWLMLEEINQSKLKLSAKASSFFASKEVQNNERQIIENLTEFTQSLSISHGLFSGLSELFGISTGGGDIYEHQKLNRLQEQLFKAFAVEVHPSSKDIIFKIYKILHEENKKALEDSQSKISLNNYEALKKNYLQSLIHFEENHPESTHYQDYKRLLVLKDKNELVKLLQGRMTLSAQRKLKKFVQSDESIENTLTIFIELIDRKHFEEELITSLSHFFHVLGQEQPQKAAEYGEKFTNSYLRGCKAKHRCEHPDEFFLKFLEKSMTKFNGFLFATFYRMAQIYPLPLTNDKSALHYRVIGLLLENIMDSMQKNPQQTVHDEFNQALLAALGAKIKRDKRLKKLKKLYQEASIFFKNHNK